MPNTLHALWPRLARNGGVSALVALAACSNDKGTVEPQPINLTATAVTLDLFATQTVTGAGGVKFVNPGRYAVMPQFAATQDFATGTSRATVPDYPFSIGGAGTLTARVEPLPEERPNLSVAEAFHMRMREVETDEAPRAMAYMQQLKARGPISLRVQSAQAAPNRDFKVLSSLTTSTYATVTARLLYEGTNVLLYVDNQPTVTTTFTDTEYQSFGKQFDEDLFPIDTRAFGNTSDIDANGKTYVLFTPIVNRLSLAGSQCGSYVAGFFNGADLSGNVNANRAEIFYSSVPGEPAGGSTCTPLGLPVVRQSAPATFIHELQHMISYNQHVLSRNAATEAVWLNEGLSHMAEELGGKLYEARYPCPNLPPCPPAGRRSTEQIFPDSAQGFLPPNFGNAYDFFSSRLDYSLTSPTGFGTIEERGVAWLFLRWLIDQKGEARLAQLLQTRNVGTANIEAVAGEPFTRLYADFLTATLLDDYPGTTAGQIPARYQYSSRNLRAIYARLNLINQPPTPQSPPNPYPTAYPLDVADLALGDRLTPTSPLQSRQMKPGSLELFSFTSTSSNTALTFKPTTGNGFLASLNAQVTVVRLPN